jgi:plasmid stabilization system protein ParE
MNGFVLHPDAYADLDEIWEFIADFSEEAADRVREEIYEAIKRLVSFPNQGHRRPDLSSRPIRFALVRELLIADSPEERPLLVIAVLHGRRSPRVIEALIRERE